MVRDGQRVGTSAAVSVFIKLAAVMGPRVHSTPAENDLTSESPPSVRSTSTTSNGRDRHDTVFPVGTHSGPS